MARTVDPERHEARRLVIIDAALTRFAADGYHGATTAAICREAGIGSGTFFHYFPTKLDLLLAILELGTGEVEEWFAAQEGRADAARVVAEFVERTAREATDPRMPGFVRAVGAVVAEPRVAAALERDERVQAHGLCGWIEAARRAGEVRTDLPAERLSQWVMVVLDGYLARLAADGLDAAAEREQLGDTVARLLAPAGA
ncbi:MAG: TetR/AcrR family transcriptional regulator [Thermoleophilia bacterium]|nr:TetR/AcrR family transcriptional regulator [Thermoleophilia bacterium]